MRENERRDVLQSVPEYPVGSERRHYPLEEKSAIIELNDMLWYPPYASDIMHYHNCMEIGMCLAGSGTVTLGTGRKPLPFSAGTVILVPAGLRHKQENRGNPMTRWRYIALDERRFLGEIPKRCQQDVSRRLESMKQRGLYLEGNDAGNEIGRIISAMFELKCRYADEVLGELEAMTLLILTRAAREPVRQEMNMAMDPVNIRSIEPALLYVSEHYHLEVRVQEMARVCAMSESYFRKVFGRLMGVSPLEYVNRYRIHRSMHLLHVTSAPISHIAGECGFQSLTTFARNFDRYVGQNPSAWRRAHVNHG